MTEPKMPTPEEMAKIHKSRTESDAELLKEGAEYAVDEKGDARLDITKEQAVDLGFEETEQVIKVGGETLVYKAGDNHEIYKGMIVGIVDDKYHTQNKTYQKARIIEFDKENPSRVLVKPLDGTKAKWIDVFESQYAIQINERTEVE